MTVRTKLRCNILAIFLLLEEQTVPLNTHKAISASCPNCFVDLLPKCRDVLHNALSVQMGQQSTSSGFSPYDKLVSRQERTMKSCQ
jgi:hypothetical protein